jgi:hypothetical protein
MRKVAKQPNIRGILWSYIGQERRRMAISVPVDTRGYAGGYIAQNEAGEIIAAASSAQELEDKLREMGYSDDNMPTLESVPERGLALL